MAITLELPTLDFDALRIGAHAWATSVRDVGPETLTSIPVALVACAGLQLHKTSKPNSLRFLCLSTSMKTTSFLLTLLVLQMGVFYANTGIDVCVIGPICRQEVARACTPMRNHSARVHTGVIARFKRQRICGAVAHHARLYALCMALLPQPILGAFRSLVQA